MDRCGHTIGSKAVHLLAIQGPARPRDKAKGRCSARSLWRKCFGSENEDVDPDAQL